MRIPVRISRLARWSRRLASIGLPLMVISIPLHRAQYLTSDTFALILAVTSFLAAVALLMAVAAFVRLWYSGHRGWSRAIQGLVISIVLLIPAGYAIFEGARTPPGNDVATAPVASLPLEFAKNPEARLLDAKTTARAFPDARTRTYPLSAMRVFGLVGGLIAGRGWQVEQSTSPSDQTAFGQINAIVTSWFGWRDEVVIVVDGRGGTTAVAMRSASFFGSADLGVNGRRIGEFLRALDNSVGKALNDELAAGNSEEPTLPVPPPRN